MFFAPDLVTRVNAAEKRTDFRHALTSYLDLVALERGAGAAPTEALEAAAEIGGGWAFERIAAALDAARQAGRRPVDRPGRAGQPRPASRNSPTWPTSPRSPGRKAPGSSRR